MTKTDTDNSNDNTEQTNTSKQPGGKTILGHRMTIQGLNDWHQVCFQWCQQQQDKQQCSMCCLKQKNTKDINEKTVSPPSDPLSTNTTTALVDTDRGRSFKDMISNYMTAPLKKYSIVVINGTDTTVDNYVEAANEKEHPTQKQARNQHIHEINIGEKAETVLDSAEWMVDKAHQHSQSLFDRWKNNNGFDYSNTLYIIKDRAVKMVDVARGKYDKTDPVKKSNAQKDSKDDDKDSSSSDPDTDDKSNNDS